MKDAYIKCAHCSRFKGEHRLVNFADGPIIGEPALVCPTAVFRDCFVVGPKVGDDHAHTDRALFEALEAAKGARREPLAILTDRMHHTFGQALCDAMNEERWRDATHLLIEKVDALYRERDEPVPAPAVAKADQ